MTRHFGYYEPVVHLSPRLATGRHDTPDLVFHLNAHWAERRRRQEA